MSSSVKFSNNVYWDPTGVILRKYTSTSSAATPTQVLNSSNTFDTDFTWIDCGGFYASNTSPEKWEVTYGSSGTKEFTFTMPFTSKPVVVACYTANSQDSNTNQQAQGIRTVTTTGFVFERANGNVNGMSSCIENTKTTDGVQWIAVGS